MSKKSSQKNQLLKKSHLENRWTFVIVNVIVVMLKTKILLTQLNIIPDYRIYFA